MPTRPPGSPDVDLTFDGASGTINGGVFMTGQFQLVPDQFFSFLEIRHNGEEEGYNTDGPLTQDQRDVQNATHSIILAEVPIVFGDGTNGTQEGVAYREFRLNIGEAGNANQYLSLDTLQIWQGASGSTTNFTSGYLAYDLDDGADRWIGLKEGANGNGANQTEFTILIPDSYFINDPAHRYVTLFSQFGMQDGWEADSSSEIWGTSVNSAALTPAMTVHKTATVPGGTANAVGEVISYAIAVANVGEVNLTGITVTDPSVTNLAAVLSGGFNIGDINHDNQLSTGETWQYTASYTVTQSDIDSLGGGDGFVENTVTGDSTQTAPVFATASVVVENDSTLEVLKTPDVASVDSAGDVIQYLITLENTGNTSLNDVTVTDSQVNIVTPIFDFNAPILGPELLVPVFNGDYNVGDTNENGFEDPGETFVFVNQGDYDQDGIIEPEEGEMTVLTNVGDTNQSGNQDPGEDWQYYQAGDTNQNGVEDPGETFQFNVNNNATPVDADDDGFNDGDINEDGQINVGETWEYTVSYTVTQDDIDNGGVYDPALTHDNTATVDTAQTGTTNATSQVPILQDPEISLTKAAVVADGSADEAGDVINYTITLQNTGNMTLTDIDVTDPSVSDLAYVSGDTDNDSKLDLTETWTFSGSYTVTQNDIDNGGVVDPALTHDNTATVTTGQAPASDSDSASVPIVQDPRVTLAKSATVVDGTADEVGDVINYTVNVANAGNMTLTGINVADPSVSNLTRVADLVGNDDNILNLGETWQYTADHTVTQADIDNGGVVNPALQYTNTASVATDQGGADADANDSNSESVPIVQSPSIVLDKTATVADGTADEVGDVINYTINVANLGNMTLTGINLADPAVSNLTRVADLVGNDDNILNVGETWQYTADHTVTQADIDNGGVVNPALQYTNTASVTTAQGTLDLDANDSDSESVPIVQSPSIVLDKTAAVPGGTADTAGEVISYAISVTNGGNMTLTGVSVADPSVLDLMRIADSVGNNDLFLDVGETWQYTASHTVTQGEIDGGGTINNTASVTTDQGLVDPDANGSDSTSVTIVQPPLPPLTLDLSLSQFASEPPPNEGDLVQFAFTFTNNTGGTITSIQVTHTLPDTLVFQTANPGSLADGGIWTTTFNHIIDAGDLGLGEVTDEVTITALDQFSQLVSITEEWTVFL